MFKNRSHGFSLVELMVVVAIIGILSSLAIPRLRTFQAKARQSEAKTNLAQIFTLEQSYFGDWDKFVAMGEVGASKCPGASDNELGFVLKPCEKSRYTYFVDITDNGTKFVARARSGAGNENKIIPGCDFADEWMIDENNDLKPIRDITRGSFCK